MANSELELYDMSEEHDDESLHEDCVLVMKPHTTSKVWAYFGLKGNKNARTSWRSRDWEASLPPLPQDCLSKTIKY